MRYIYVPDFVEHWKSKNVFRVPRKISY